MTGERATQVVVPDIVCDRIRELDPEAGTADQRDPTSETYDVKCTKRADVPCTAGELREWAQGVIDAAILELVPEYEPPAQGRAFGRRMTE